MIAGGASGMARLPVPVAMSSAWQGPGGRTRWLMNWSPPLEMVRATTPKSPAIQVERMAALIRSIGGDVMYFALGKSGVTRVLDNAVFVKG